MPRHIWTLLCDKAITDSQSNNVSLINVIEQLNVSKAACKPLLDGEEEIVHLQHEHVLCGLWVKEGEGDVEKFYARVEFRSPTNVALGGANVEIDFQDKPRTRVMFKSGGFPIVGEGTYHFIVEYRISDSDPWTESARIPVQVRITHEADE